MYAMNTLKLRAVMLEKGDNYEDLAKDLNITVKTLCLKINGKSEFNRAEMQKIKNRYTLTAQDMTNIFFE